MSSNVFFVSGYPPDGLLREDLIEAHLKAPSWMDGEIDVLRIACPGLDWKDFQSVNFSNASAFNDAHTLVFGEYVHDPLVNVLSDLSEAVWSFISDHQSIAAVSAADRLAFECEKADPTEISSDAKASLAIACLRYNEILEAHGRFAMNMLATTNHSVSDFPFLEALLAWRLRDGNEASQLQKMRIAVRALAKDSPIYGETLTQLAAKFSTIEDRLGLRMVTDDLRDTDFVKIEAYLRRSYVGGKHARYADR
jgi:hypothetical protein